MKNANLWQQHTNTWALYQLVKNIHRLLLVYSQCSLRTQNLIMHADCTRVVETLPETMAKLRILVQKAQANKWG